MDPVQWCREWAMNWISRRTNCCPGRANNGEMRSSISGQSEINTGKCDWVTKDIDPRFHWRLQDVGRISHSWKKEIYGSDMSHHFGPNQGPPNPKFNDWWHSPYWSVWATHYRKTWSLSSRFDRMLFSVDSIFFPADRTNYFHFWQNVTYCSKKYPFLLSSNYVSKKYSQKEKQVQPSIIRTAAYRSSLIDWTARVSPKTIGATCWSRQSTSIRN
jgi:hypothetical protein